MPIARIIMSHNHNHDHGVSRLSDSRLLWAFVINQVLTVAQVVAGILSGSTALLSDAAHNFNDANALLIAYIARRFSRKQANERFTFGYRRAELIGAIINLTLLAVIGLYLMYQGVALRARRDHRLADGCGRRLSHCYRYWHRIAALGNEQGLAECTGCVCPQHG